MISALLVSTAAAAAAQTDVWLADGCFWEAQYAYWKVEADPKGPFKRANGTISSRTGYAGSTNAADDHLVCYHHDGGDQNDDYATLGYTEAVHISLDAGKEREQFAALLKAYFGAFTDSADGWTRPDPGDMGPPYRSAIGIPGGVGGDLYKLVVSANTQLAKTGQYNNSMKLVPDEKGSGTDEFNQVWIMDSTKFPFHRAEQYHQFHSNFAGPSYPDSYINTLWHLMIKLGKINPTGCPEGDHW